MFCLFNNGILLLLLMTNVRSVHFVYVDCNTVNNVALYLVNVYKAIGFLHKMTPYDAYIITIHLRTMTILEISHEQKE